MSEVEKIGLCLSGGGVRALAFHLGILKYLAEAGMWKSIESISTVSGGSLAVALILAKNESRWPTEDVFIDQTETSYLDAMTKLSIPKLMLRCAIVRPWRILSRAQLLADAMRKYWGLKYDLSDLPSKPELLINCTTYETGKNWRFSKARMGDYLTGYVANPSFPLAEAFAASAAFPGLVGPLKLNFRNLDKIAARYGNETLKEKIKDCVISLWDGGIYENLGIEALYKSRKLQRGLDFLVISDASGQLGIEKRKWSFWPPFYLAPLRLVSIATDQTRALRARDVMATFMETPNIGRYLYIANSVPEIFRRADKHIPLDFNFQNEGIVKSCSSFATTLRKLTNEEYSNLIKRGYEVAKATFVAYQ
jgi:NTE family protein